MVAAAFFFTLSYCARAFIFRFHGSMRIVQELLIVVPLLVAEECGSTCRQVGLLVAIMTPSVGSRLFDGRTESFFKR